MSTSTLQRTYSGHEGNRQTDFNQTDLISLSLTIDVSKLTRTNQWLLTNFSQVFQPIRSQLNWPILFNGPGFSFANSCYKQINGVAMGTKMGPSYTNLFVGYIEQQFFNQCNGPKPELYRRYIVNCVGATSSTREELNQFITAVNSLHPALNNKAFLERPFPWVQRRYLQSQS